MKGFDDRQVNALSRISSTWPVATIRAYMENNTRLADELEDEGLDSTQALEDAANWGQVLVRRHQQERPTIRRGAEHEPFLVKEGR